MVKRRLRPADGAGVFSPIADSSKGPAPLVYISGHSKDAVALPAAASESAAAADSSAPAGGTSDPAAPPASASTVNSTTSSTSGPDSAFSAASATAAAACSSLSAQPATSAPGATSVASVGCGSAGGGNLASPHLQPASSTEASSNGTVSGAGGESRGTPSNPIQLYAKRSGVTGRTEQNAARNAMLKASAAAAGMSVDVPDDVDFTIKIAREMDPKKVKVGDTVHARLVEDLYVDLKKIASAGDDVIGTVTKVVDGKRTIKSYVPTKHWLNSQGRLTVAFNEIVTAEQRHITINANPIPYSYIDRANPSRVEYLVNKEGELTVHYAVFKYLAWDALINTCVIAAGDYGIMAAPAVTGAVGVMCPEYAQGHPVDPTVTQSRMRNFMLGAGRGANGGWLIYGMSTKGMNIGLQQGDKLEVRIKAGQKVSLNVAATAAATPKAVATVHAERVPH